MKICLVEVYTGFYFEPLGLEAIRMFLEEHNITTDIRFINTNEPMEYITKTLTGYDFIGFSCSHINANYIYNLAVNIKESIRQPYIFLGGIFSTLCAHLILNDCKAIDFIVLGHGEDPLLELLNTYALTARLVSNDYVILQNENISDKKSYIYPICQRKKMTHNLLGTDSFKYTYIAQMFTSLSCCSNCTFCTHNYSVNNRANRWKGRIDIDQIFEEMIDVYQNFGIRMFNFTDGSFEDPGNKGKRYISDLCDHLISYPIRFSISCMMRTESFKEYDKPLLEKMKAAGFAKVLLGIESMDVDDLYFFNKIAKPEDHVSAVALFNEVGISTTFGLIMFNPYTTIQSLQKNFDFLIKNKVYLSQLYGITLDIYYGSQVYYKLLDQGMLKNSYTYLNTKQYRFFNSRIEKIVSLLEQANEVCMDVILRENEFQLFEDLYRAALNIYHLEDNDELMIEFRNKLFVSVSSFYEFIYFHAENSSNDIFQHKILTYKETMLAYYDQFQVIKYGIMRKKFFREFLSSRKFTNGREVCEKV